MLAGERYRVWRFQRRDRTVCVPCEPALRQEPAGFVSLSQDTLADDAEIRPVNVRRLLSLLRRLALLRGVDYVFEPNDDTFRRANGPRCTN